MSKHILLVDDDGLKRRSLSYNLGQHGYRVSTAASGHDALTIAGQDTPDVILLDIGLPEMDGLDTLRLREKIEADPFDQVLASESAARSGKRLAARVRLPGPNGDCLLPALVKGVVHAYPASQTIN